MLSGRVGETKIPQVFDAGQGSAATGQKRRLAVITVLALTVAVAIVYTNVMTFEPEAAAASGYSDVEDYLAMYHDNAGRSHRGYRILVPFLASLLPDPPSTLFSSPPDPSRLTVLKFGVVNLFFLVGAAVLLHLLQRGLGLRYLESVFGVVFFLGSVPVVRSGGLPMADPALYFFFLLCLLAVQRDQPVMLAAAVAVGVIANELVLLVLAAIPLTHLSVRRKGVNAAAIVPGVAIYVIVRALVETAGPHTYAVADLAVRLWSSLGRFLTLEGVADFVVLSFGVTWAPAAWAAFGCTLPPLLKRWSWLVLLVVAGVLVGGGNLGRSTFTAFPVVIPLAALGVSSWLTGERDFSGRTAGRQARPPGQEE